MYRNGEIISCSRGKQYHVEFVPRQFIKLNRITGAVIPISATNVFSSAHKLLEVSLTAVRGRKVVDLTLIVERWRNTKERRIFLDKREIK